MTIARDDLWNNYCPGNETQDTVMLDPFLFKYSLNVGIINLFQYCQEIPPQHRGGSFNFNCSQEGEVITGFYTVPFPNLPLPNTCQVLEINVPVLLTALDDLKRTGNLSEALNKGFEVEYLLGSTPCSACYLSGGKCGSNQSAPGQFLCYCPDREPQMSTCPTPTPTPTSSPPGMFLCKYRRLPLCFKAYIILV
ncbi:hypothetical protein Q3G72_002265 [Acer saccharum]|nr:hypothetical protein Q3G72_002265 [Acer saccharum]